MSLGEEIMEELYEVHIIPQYKNLLGKCLSIFYEMEEVEKPNEILEQSTIIKELEEFLKINERKS